MTSPVVYNNLTQISESSKTLAVYSIVFLFLTIICFGLFFLCISMLLYIFWSTDYLRDNSRYILFAHMLVNDTVYLVIGFYLLLGSLNNLTIPMPTCYSIVTLAGVTFRITPYNLAVMALERYVAICFPLRHGLLCTPRRSYFAIAIMWVISLIPNLADFIILMTSPEASIFSFKVICTRELLIVKPIQKIMRSITNIAVLSTVSCVIVFTYVSVMFVAKKISSGNNSASKAGMTVLLHALQFLLCIMSLTYTFTEAAYASSLTFLPFANFLFFTCLPRCLSPVIYGIRDNVFRKSIRRLFTPKPKS
ncbi:odorant receptor 131-2-like [Hyperolius riggenbachi]|uniref:odorant receptor 131-2-like n=1 Tax=Hyperolius riggenbachi TaxID=752182 RepID=UPI0035A3D613